MSYMVGRYALFLIVASVLTVATAPLHLGPIVSLLIGTAAAAGLLGPIFVLRRRKEAGALAAGPEPAAFEGVRPSRVAGGGPLATLARPAAGVTVTQAKPAPPAHRASGSPIKVLVCAFERRFSALVEADADRYRAVWPATTTSATFTAPSQFLNALAEGFDIVHLLGEVADDRQIAGLGYTGARLIADCAASGVRLLWIASDNPPQVYIDGFHTQGQPMNLIMTLQRQGPVFGTFLGKLLAEMSAGEGLGLAWVRLCPQGVPGPAEPDAPATICVMGAPNWPAG